MKLTAQLLRKIIREEYLKGQRAEKGGNLMYFLETARDFGTVCDQILGDLASSPDAWEENYAADIDKQLVELVNAAKSAGFNFTNPGVGTEKRMSPPRPRAKKLY
jgi:hypothetical protein